MPRGSRAAGQAVGGGGSMIGGMPGVAEPLAAAPADTALRLSEQTPRVDVDQLVFVETVRDVVVVQPKFVQLIVTVTVPVGVTRIVDQSVGESKPHDALVAIGVSVAVHPGSQSAAVAGLAAAAASATAPRTDTPILRIVRTPCIPASPSFRDKRATRYATAGAAKYEERTASARSSEVLERPASAGPVQR